MNSGMSSEEDPTTIIPAPVAVAPVAAEPPKELDIALSFDTTGSMHSVLYQVRNELARVVDVLFNQSAHVELM